MELCSLQQLTPWAGQSLYHSDSPYIEIRQHGQLRWMHFSDNAVQACMSLQEPHQLLLAYTQAMLAGLVFIDPPKRLLNLGIGGGSFERFFYKTLPGLAVESVDSSARVIELCKRFFEINTDSSIYCERAEDFVAESLSQYDLVFCDLFAEGAHPKCIFDGHFYGNCYQRLNNTGVLVINLLIRHEEQMKALLEQVRKHFNSLALLAVPDHANTILFALKQPVIDETFWLTRAQQLGDHVGVDLKSHLERMVMLLPTADKV